LQRKTKQVFSSQHDKPRGNLQTPSQNIHAIPRQKPPKKERYGKHATKKHCDLFNDYPYQHHIFALIITIGPTPQICNQYLSKQTNPRGLDILRKLQKMPLDKTNAEQLDTLDTFFKNNQDLLNNQNPVQNQLYPYITNPNNQINEESLKGKFPFLLQELIK
jgi:hypothetical protein